MEEHFVGKVAQKAIIEHDGKVLIVRDPRDATIWEIPGGRLNVKEQPAIAIKREVFEELGVEIEVHEIFYAEQFTYSEELGPHIYLFYRATLKNPEKPFLLKQDEVLETRWITKEQLNEQKIYDTFKHALNAYFTAR